ncbi:MAG: hypothetical protein R3190_18375 [Thermoanaerobaculia bacterium]|nr:hypothetical protein [Thermoanaerobaculia bacterium]
MRRALRAILAAGLMSVAGLYGCGGDRTERGLSPAEEPAVPESDRALAETEAERQAEVVEKDDAASAKLFDEAEREEE